MKVQLETLQSDKPGWSHAAWVLHGPEGSAVVSLNKVTSIEAVNVQVC